MGGIWSEDAENKQVKLTQLPSIYRANALNVLVIGNGDVINEQLVVEFLTSSKLNIFWLITKNKSLETYNRLKENMLKDKIWQSEYSERIKCYEGNVTCQYFGLQNEDWLDLEECIDLIFYNESLNSFIMPYKLLYKNNVEPIRELIKFATTGCLKKIVYFSMANIICGDADGSNQCFDEDVVVKEVKSNYGLVQSKWVAESLLRGASEQGLPLVILRLPHIVDVSNTQDFDKRDFFLLRLKLCIKLGIVPDVDFPYCLVPNNMLAKIAVYMGLTVDKGCYMPAIPYGLTWREIFEALIKSGYKLNFVGIEAFTKRAIEYIKESEDYEMKTMLPFLTMKYGGFDCPYFRNEKTKEMLRNSPIKDLTIMEIIQCLNSKSIGKWLVE